MDVGAGSFPQCVQRLIHLPGGAFPSENAAGPVTATLLFRAGGANVIYDRTFGFEGVRLQAAPSDKKNEPGFSP